MRSLIKLLVVLVICLAGIGIYRGWFGLSNANPGADGDKVNVNMSVDKDKMKSDIKMAKKKVKEEIRELEGKTPDKKEEAK
jgi:hypothetical protein